MKNMLFTLMWLVLLIGALGGAKALQIMDLIKAGESMEMPASVVSTTTASNQQWVQSIPAIGSMEAVQGVTVTADTPGRVTHIHFKSGQDVSVGETLIQQDTRSEKAQLRAAEASVELAQVNLKRITELLDKKASSIAEFDRADAQYKEAVARADTIRTAIDKKTIKAPFSGRLGIRSVNLGQDLGSGDAIVSLQAVDPILVNFYLPQQELSRLASKLKIELESDAIPGKTFEGTVTAINTEVDPATRNVKVQASLNNADKQLLPGMFANLRVVFPEIETVLAVPATAIAYATFGDSVFVVKEQKDETSGETKHIAQQQFVQLGEARGDFVAITKGLSEGEQVVSAGVFKLFNGAPVSVNNDTQPDYQLSPSPEDS